MHVLSIIAASSSSSSNPLGLFVPMILIGAAMYFLMIRPQRRKLRAQASLQSSIEVGDEVVTTSGVYGFVTLLEGDIAWLEIDDDVQIRIARAALQRKVDTSNDDAADPLEDGSSRGSKIEPSDGSAADEPSK
ncbi:MAG: preprotein translocase subunit YajC [Ilumatobacteraceae bacterium]|jgi:preprotein translocase subunit YajC|nr:preprotein translocase subunit YajC [Ilumatobacteraceae bacterium]